MRFSLLSLITIVTAAGLLINLFSTYHAGRRAESELATMLAQNEALAIDTKHFHDVLQEWQPNVDRRQRAYDARTQVLEQAQRIFHELVPEQSAVVPVDGKVSIRGIPAITGIKTYRQGFAIHVPDTRGFEIELRFKDQRSIFVGFDRKMTFPLRSGLNSVMFESTSGDNKTILRLKINNETIATATAEGHESNGHGYMSFRMNPQTDYAIDQGKSIPKLIDYNPNIMFEDDEEATPNVELRLLEITE